MDGQYRKGPESEIGSDSIEMFFDAIDSNGNLPFVNFVDDLLPLIDSATNTFVTGWISLRFTRNTRASLGMQQWGITCAIEIATLPNIVNWKDLLGLVLELMYHHGGKPHWGQLNNLTVPGHGSIYSRFSEWRE